MRIFPFPATLWALLLLAAPCLAADPAMVIVFAGNSYGYYDPCPTCGPAKLGGLARRSTFIQQLRRDPATAGKTLAVAGAFEFLPEVSAAPPEPDKIPAIAKAQDRIGYDAGALSPGEARLLTAKKATPPAVFTLLDGAPQTKVVSVGGKSVGLVFFPVPRNESDPVPDKLMDAVAQAAKGLREKTALVIGISPWGALDEEAFVNTRPGVVDVLLGSGGGSGFGARTPKDGKTLWTRAYIKGKTVNRLDLMALPGAKDFVWKPGKTFVAQVVPLDTAYPQDQSIEGLF
jgi:peptidoglycan hydrolase-like protein with peptidoglycan-binding domain